MNNSPTLESTHQIITYLKEKGIAHMNVDGDHIYDNILKISNRELVNFGSCSYLGLEFDPRLKDGASNSLDIYGTQFSASRAYVSAGMYASLEEKLQQIFGGYVLVTPTTTLGHISTIPVLIGRNDCVIMDHQVHHSVQTAVKLAKADGTRVEMVRHNRIDLLEKRIIELKDKYESIWYMADGIYSMYGDKAPMKELEALLNKHEKFHLYVDDAHAMSCFGENGRGYALSEIELHPKMVMGTSLNKAFAAGGGAFIFPNKEMFDRVRNCGGPMITSGPMQQSALGAAIAAADIHLSPEIKEMQAELMDNILYCHHLLEKNGLPNLAETESPIFFIGVGAPKPAYDLIDRMIKDGFLVNIGIFPAVPMKNTGLRFTITRLHTFKQIEQMVISLAKHYFEVLSNHDTSLEQVCKAFKIDVPVMKISQDKLSDISGVNKLQIELKQTVIDVDKFEWNNHLGFRSSFDWTALNILENSFNNNSKREQNWDFEYLTIKDQSNKIVLQTFFTAGLIKDDMLMDKTISLSMEQIRMSDAYYGTSNFLAMGCMITEGNHLYIDNDHPKSKTALKKMYQVIDELQKKYGSTQIILRDFPDSNTNMNDIMVDHGFFRFKMPDNYILDISEWSIEDCYTTILSKKSRKHFRTNVEKSLDNFNISVHKEVSENELMHYYKLYLNVQDKNLEINSFELPFKLFQTMNQNENWEFIELSLKSEFGYNEPVAVVLAYKGINAYCPTMMGIDYSVNTELNTYRQAIFQAIKAGKKLGYNEIRLGFSAGMEKRKFGAKGFGTVAYMQSTDHFNMEAILSAGSTISKESVQL